MRASYEIARVYLGHCGFRALGVRIVSLPKTMQAKTETKGKALHELTAGDVRMWLEMPPTRSRLGNTAPAIATQHKRVAEVRGLMEYAKEKSS